jgi:nucleoside-diphosphate-sugar epimerase
MRILITGGKGMLGSAIKNQLRQKTGVSFVSAPSRYELDLLDYPSLKEFLVLGNFDLVIHCAALVGGIRASVDHPFEFLNTNVRIDSNLMHAALELRIPALMYMASSCMYPAITSQPMAEEQLLTGELEETNEGYALAKLVGTKMVEAVAKNMNWRAFILSNLYGPGDKYGEDNSHLIAAIINKVSKAVRSGESSIEMWGSGNARREFTYVEDVAQYLVQSIEKIDSLPPVMNLGFGREYSVLEYYNFVCTELSFFGSITPNLTQPEGMQQKLMDSSLARSYGWNPKTEIGDGIRITVSEFLSRGEVSK